MGATAAIMVVGALAGTAIQGAMAKDPPQMLMEQPPKPDANANKQAAAGAADQQRKRAAASGGRSDTLKTGPQGLGEVGSQNLEQKQLLGY
jgi:hypothetical protein